MSLTANIGAQAATRTGLLIASILLILSVGCGGGNRIGEKASQEWTASTTEAVVSAIVDLVIGNGPIAASLASDVITKQVNDHLTWDYSAAEKSAGGLYRVTATGTAEVTFEVPLVGSKTYQAVLPFDL